MRFEVQESGSVELGLKTFFYIENSYMGSAVIEKFHDDIWHFNRLYIHKNLRGRGIGTALVNKTAAFCNENKVTLINVLNPYGDLQYEQLKHFYLKNGFSVGPIEGVLVILKAGDSLERFLPAFAYIRGA